MPDWFIRGATQLAVAWNSKKSDALDMAYHRTMMAQKDAGQDEPFTYYSWFANGTTPDTVNGAPFLMHAPSPNGMVVNEYFKFVPHAYAQGDPVFALPATPTCTPAGFASTPSEAARIIRGSHERFKHLALAEVFLGTAESL